MLKIFSELDEDLVFTVADDTGCTPGSLIQTAKYTGIDRQKFYMTNQNGALMFHSKFCPGMVIAVSECQVNATLHLENMCNYKNQQFQNPLYGVLQSNIPTCSLVLSTLVTSSPFPVGQIVLNEHVSEYPSQMWDAIKLSYDIFPV